MMNASQDFPALATFNRMSVLALANWLRKNANKFEINTRLCNIGGAAMFSSKWFRWSTPGTTPEWGTWTPKYDCLGYLAVNKAGEEAFKREFGVELRQIALLGLSTPGFVDVSVEQRDGAPIRRLRRQIYTLGNLHMRALVFHLDVDPTRLPTTGMMLHLDRPYCDICSSILPEMRFPGRLTSDLTAHQAQWNLILLSRLPRPEWKKIEKILNRA